MSVMEIEKNITKQEVVDQFNQALALLDTTSEDLRLRALVSKTFKEPPKFTCGITEDIALLHQYQAMHSPLDEPNWIQEKDAKHLLVFSQKLCFGGMRLTEIESPNLLEIFAQHMPKTEDVLAPLMLNNEKVLLVENLQIEESYGEMTMQSLVSALSQHAHAQAFDYLAIHATYVLAKSLVKALDPMKHFYATTADGEALVMFRVSKIH